MTDIFEEISKTMEINAKRTKIEKAAKKGYATIHAVEYHNTIDELIADMETRDEVLARQVDSEEATNGHYRKMLMHPKVGPKTMFAIAKSIRSDDGTLKRVVDKASMLVYNHDLKAKIRTAVIANKSAGFFTKLKAKSLVDDRRQVKNADAGYTPLM